MHRFNEQIPNWQTLVYPNNPNQDFLKIGQSAGFDYWIKPLEDYRIELFPEIAIGYSEEDLLDSPRGESFKLLNAGFNLNTNIYVLNFKSDCDCPTFSKQESFLEKGLFLQLSPGIHYIRGIYKLADADDPSNNTVNTFVPKLGLGVGLDIGVTDLITVSPIFRYNRFFNVAWDNLAASVNDDPSTVIVDAPDTSHINRLSLGIHFTVRWRT